MNLKNNKSIVLEMNVENDTFDFPDTISDALIKGDTELHNLEEELNETLETVKLLTSECDKYDYTLSACSGALCGIIDVFLIGKPGESPLGNITDKWFANRTVDLSKDTFFLPGSIKLSSKVDLPTCLGPVTSKTGNVSLTFFTVSFTVLS